MYIIHKTIGLDDPRMDPRMEYKGSFWCFTCTYIPDGLGIHTDWIPGAEVGESVAKAIKFCSSYEGELSVRRHTTQWEEIEHASAEADQGIYPEKIIYELTPDDISNTTALIKTMMRVYNNLYQKDPETQFKINNAIDQIRDVNQAQMALGVYFGVLTAYSNGKDLTPPFPISWN